MHVASTTAIHPRFDRDRLAAFARAVARNERRTHEPYSSCTLDLRGDELPRGRIIAGLSGHVVAVIDGVVHLLTRRRTSEHGATPVVARNAPARSRLLRGRAPVS
jgi:hypothetical protein